MPGHIEKEVKHSARRRSLPRAGDALHMNSRLVANNKCCGIL